MAKSFIIIFVTIVLLLTIPSISHAQARTNQADTSLSIAEISKPTNWIARGGCWDFSRRIITGRGIGQRPIAYYSQKSFTDFVFEVRLRLLTDEDGSYGLVFRFDEKKDVGYIFGVWPHGGYEFARLDDFFAHQTGGGLAVYLKDQLKTWNRLKVVAKGAKFALYINDNLLVTMEDHSFRSGKVGFYLGHGPTSILEYEVLSLEAQ